MTKRKKMIIFLSYFNAELFMISENDRKIILRFAKKYRLSSVILFGSSFYNPDAKDIDIGIKGIKPASFFDFYWDIYSRLSKPVDVINLDKKNKFNQLVEQDGQTIYGKIIGLSNPSPESFP